MAVYEDIKRGDLLNEGKTKQIYSAQDRNDVVIVVNKDRITANNAQMSHELPGKARCSNVTNAAVFDYLNKAGLETSFIRILEPDTYLARRCRMIPIEWVARRLATGSFLKRNPGVKEGFRFSPVKLETFYKDDEAGDPEWSKAQVLCKPLDVFGKPVTEHQYNLMINTTRVVFEVLERAWATLNCTLVDMKVEYGILDSGEIVLSDVIDNDSWRLWEGGNKDQMRDKQVYRNLKDFNIEELKKVKLNYEWVEEKVVDFCKPSSNLVVLVMGSASDIAIGDSIKQHCDSVGLRLERRIMSAHKVTEETLQMAAYYNSLPTPVVYIAVAGRSNGLGPVLAGNTALPVINCPPVKVNEQTHDVWSSLSVPRGLGCSTVVYPETAVLHAASIFGTTDHAVWSRLRCLQHNRTRQLARDDQVLLHGDQPELKQ